MIIFQKADKFGFLINWTFLLIGYCGSSNIPVQVTKQEICDYAVSQLENKIDSNELIIDLVSTGTDDFEFRRTLEKLSSNEQTDFNLQVRKWRVILVKETLETLPKNAFDGLIALSELWVTLEFPDGCPHIFQGRNNSISPEEYYTDNTLSSVLERHGSWINSEIKEINFSELSTRV